jgi:hypothetical protein
MKQLRYTLLADGSSDRTLMPIIDWLLWQKLPDCRVVPQFASLGAVGLTLAHRVPVALKMFPCDLLFVHRDAEGAPVAQRLREIADVMRCYEQRYVPVVPVRMTEAWLLSDERAIRRAAGNQHGRHQLGLPDRRRWEGRPDPKADLAHALRAASGKTKRRQSRDEFSRQRILVAEYTDDFSGLRGLASFDELELQLAEKLRDL